MPFEPGQQVGRYRVIRLLAQGGMAEVYRAEQELAAGIFRPAALKVIRPEYSGSPDFREMFLDEARTACTLSHPNIVHIYEVGEVDELLYMAMELVPGETLSTVSRILRDKHQPFTTEALLAVGIYTCSALEAVHALTLPGEGHLNLVHRDVSPHNLLLSSSGSLKLIDFGIAKAATNRNLTSPGVTKGKAGYFSPEQAMGKSLDGRSDLFSIGVTLYKLAAGVTPFDEHKSHQTRNSALVHGRWEPLSKHCPQLPAGFHAVIDKVLQVKPEDRYAGAREMREALEQVALQSQIHVGPGSLVGYVSKDEVNSARAPVHRPTPPPAALAALPGGATPSAAPRASRPPLKPKGAPSRQEVTEVERRSLVRRKTEPVMRRLGGARASLGRLGPAGLGLAVLAVGGVALGLWRPWQRPHPQVPPVRAELPPRQAIRLEQPIAIREETPGEPDDELAVDAPAPSSRAEEPKREVRRPRPAAPKVVAPEPKPPPEIPKGEGRLRIGATPEGVVRVGRETWGPTPVDRRVSSGQYLVSFRSPDGKHGKCPAVVMPDKTTILIYSFATNSCGGNE